MLCQGTSLFFSYYQLAEITIRAPWNHENLRSTAAKGLLLLQQVAKVRTVKALVTCNVVVQGTDSADEPSYSMYYGGDFATLGNDKPIDTERWEGQREEEVGLVGQRSLLVHDPRDISTPADLDFMQETYDEEELIDKFDGVLYQQSRVNVVEVVNVVIILRAVI